jgi:hypothetical protein
VGVLLAVATLNFIKNPNTSSVICCHRSVGSVLSGCPKRLEAATVLFLSSRPSHQGISSRPHAVPEFRSSQNKWPR